VITAAEDYGIETVAVQTTPVLENGEYVMYINVGGVNDVGAAIVSVDARMVASYPSELAMDVTKLIRSTPSGAYLATFVPYTGQTWAELFFTERALLYVDKDVTMQGLVRGFVEEPHWDLSLRLVRALSKKFRIPDEFTDWTGVAATTANLEIVLDHFIEYGITGFLLSATSSNVLVEQPIAWAPVTDEGKRGIYSMLLTYLSNVSMILQAHRPRALYKPLARVLGIC
jgi:hypothetical protein